MMKRIYLILPILAGMMFGSSGIFVRTLTQNGIDPTTLLFLRFSIAIIPLLIAILATDKNLFKINLKDIPLFLVCSLCIIYYIKKIDMYDSGNFRMHNDDRSS